MRKCSFLPGTRAVILPGSVVLAVVLIWIGWTAPLCAQSFTASLQGTVTDSSGAIVPQTQLTLANEETNIKHATQSNERGVYLFARVPPGVYRLTAELPGFRTFVSAGMRLQVQQQAVVDVVLTPGDLTSMVEVTGEAPRLDVVSPTLGRVVDNTSILNMPLNTRNASFLTRLTPGIIQQSTDYTTNFVSNGVRAASSDVLIDGVTTSVHEQGGGATDQKYQPSVEVVQEFKVQTNSFSAEYGFTGGTVVNMITRSGTNGLHGTAFEFLRNSMLNANTFFSNRAGSQLVKWRRNQFGGAVGGPVVLPKLYDGRNRTFFYVHMESARQTGFEETTLTVPSAQQKQGIFTDYLDSKGSMLTIFDPFSVSQAGGTWARAPFAGNTIPSSRFNPVAAAVVKFYPDPNRPGTAFTQTSNFYNAGSRVSNDFQQTFKGDHVITDRQRMSIRYSRAGFNITRPNLWGNWMNPASGASPRLQDTDSGSLDYTNTLSPSTVLNLRWGVAREDALSSMRCGDCKYDPAKDLGFQGPINSVLPPQFSVEGYASVGPDRWARIIRGEDVNHLVASVVSSRGRHMLSMGGEARLYRLNYGQPGVDVASFSFTRRITMQNPFTSNSAQGNGLASFLLGWGSSGGQNVYLLSSMAYQSYAGFLQDDIKITPKLTLNLGLRYERPVPETDRYNRLSWVDTTVTSPLSGKVAAFPNLRGGLRFASPEQRHPFDADTNNWAPRFGFAYRVLPKTVVRGGYGIYYGITRGQMSSGLGLGFRTSTDWTTSLDSGVTQYASVSNPFPDGINKPIGSSQGLSSYIGQSISGPIRDWSTNPYYQQWSLSLQRELPSNSVAEAVYTGSRGVHLGSSDNANLNRIDQSYYTLGAGLNDMVANPFYGVITDPVSTLSKATVVRSQLLRPYPQYAGASGVSGLPAPPIGNSIYHAAQFKFAKRYSHGLNLSAHYTFSKMIDDGSLSASGMSWIGGSTSLQYYSNLRLERAVSIYDITHRAVMDFTYELPLGRGRAAGSGWSRWLDAVAGGWQVNGILVLQSGSPLLPSLSSGVLPDSTQRPNLLSEPGLGGSIQSRLNRYLNPDAFSRPAAYTFGNAPRTLSRVRAQGSKGADASLFKSFYFSGDRKRYVQLRMEAFNVTNTPIFSAPNMSVGSTSFGVVSSQANTPREVQVALKIAF